MFEGKPIYLDNQATTPLDPRVLDAMMPYLTSEFGNAASRTHAFGWRAEEAVTVARKQVADLIGASEKEIIFTSGATESTNMAIKGVVEAYGAKGNHVITSTIEHKAVLDTCRHLETLRTRFRAKLRSIEPARVSRDRAMSSVDSRTTADDGLPVEAGGQPLEEAVGARVTYVRVSPDGRVQPNRVAEEISDSTLLVSVMLANNEIGTIQPVREIAAIAASRGVLVHSDIAQGLGKIPISVDELKLDLASLSAHKIYGPKGVGALYVRSRPRVRVAPLLDGGGHERGFRSGTLDVPGIVGFGAACDFAKREMASEARQILALRERLRHLLWSGLDGLTLNGSLDERLPGNLNVSFAGVESEALMMGLKNVAVSSGSACTSASLEPSYVLKACGVPDEAAYGSIRFAVGRFNTEDEIMVVAAAVIERVNLLRRLRSA